ncbi:Putative glucose-6-phosphate 1-epimerase [Cedecea neteri]|uniref:Glucose-6-phosphate 1-epimerase n=1 Tax=Cedecea neteri TaxID=158822 RepID=A0A2X3JE06_9ENTR|nr:Putative glucose-6-phosphate 1-epimerase [Cedecea neteri]
MINKIFALPVVEQITPALTRRVNDELDVIVVDHPTGAGIFPHFRALTCSPGSLPVKMRYCG